MPLVSFSFWYLEQYSGGNTYKFQSRLFYFNICIFQWDLFFFIHLYKLILLKVYDLSQSLCLNFYNTTEESPSLYTPQSRETEITYTYVVGTFGKCKLGMLTATPSSPCLTALSLGEVFPQGAHILPCP